MKENKPAEQKGKKSEQKRDMRGNRGKKQDQKSERKNEKAGIKKSEPKKEEKKQEQKKEQKSDNRRGNQNRRENRKRPPVKSPQINKEEVKKKEEPKKEEPKKQTPQNQNSYANAVRKNPKPKKRPVAAAPRGPSKPPPGPRPPRQLYEEQPQEAPKRRPPQFSEGVFGPRSRGGPRTRSGPEERMNHLMENTNTMSSPPISAKALSSKPETQKQYKSPSPPQQHEKLAPHPKQQDPPPARKPSGRKPPIRDPAIVSAKEATPQTEESKPPERSSKGQAKDLRSTIVDKIGELMGIVQHVIDYGNRTGDPKKADAEFLTILKQKSMEYTHRKELAKVVGRTERGEHREPRKLTDPMKPLYHAPPGFDSNPPRQHPHANAPSRPPHHIPARKPPIPRPSPSHEHPRKYPEGGHRIVSPHGGEPVRGGMPPFPLTNVNMQPEREPRTQVRELRPPGLGRPPPKLTIYIETKKGRVPLYISEGDDVGEVTQRFCQKYDMVEFFDAIYLNVMKKLRNVEKAQQAHNNPHSQPQYNMR